MFIDSHCHLDRVDLTPYSNNVSEYLEATQADLLDHMLCVSIDWEAYPAMRDLVAGQEKISISVGVHPNETEGHDPSVDELVATAIRDNAIAIGETGLDYYRLEDEGHLSCQQQRFRNHITAAKLTNKPIIIHTRDAKEDTIRIMDEEGAGETGGVLHCFTEDWEMAKKALDLGFYISFSGIVTFKNAKQVQEVAQKVPQDRFLIETDSPYLAPVPMRGKQNYPNYVKYVAEKMAEIKGFPLKKIADISAKNYNTLFNR
ncbi:MAG: deoxyribonuclease [Cycloclasticus sp. symbiont of Bathymodiolus heckerae]|nr:MAG: deoxyribonuclease [Cycloclasticus sp. symbiont of Bathymodiolus heckerae]